MHTNLIKILECPKCTGELRLKEEQRDGDEIRSGSLICRTCGENFSIINSIPRFVTTEQYVSSFGFEWTKFSKTQLDSANGTNQSEERFKQSLDFALEELEGKLILDAGCGMGRFMEIALKYGGTIIGVDMSLAIEAAYQNLHKHSNAHFIQADIFQLPFKEGSFDFIYSLGVLHHTPDTRGAFAQLPPLLKPGGKISVTLYANYNKAYVYSSEFWRFFTKRFPKRLLYALAHIAIPLYYVYRLPGIGKLLSVALPISLHPRAEWRVLDTFDHYSPTYQFYLSHFQVFRWFEDQGLKDIKVLEPGVSLLGAKEDRSEAVLV